MSAAEKYEDPQHIPLVLLWKFRMNERPLTTDEMLHVSTCDECISLLGLCVGSVSLKELERRLDNRRRGAC
jgi:hypothetical protein